jgi:hypothetical protein
MGNINRPRANRALGERRAWIAGRLRPLLQHSEEKTAVGDGDPAGTEPGHNRLNNHDPGDDDIRPGGLQPRNPPAKNRGKFTKPKVDLFDLFSGQLPAVDSGPVVNLQAKLDRRQGGEGAAEADQGGGAGKTGNGLIQDSSTVFPHPGEIGKVRFTAGGKPFPQPDAAQGKADHPLPGSPAGGDYFRRTAADVGQNRSRSGKAEAGESPAADQPGFLLPGDHLDLDPQGLGPAEKIPAVGGQPEGLGPHRPETGYPPAGEVVFNPPQRRQGPPGRRRLQAP